MFHCVAAALHCNLSVALLYDVGLSRYLYVRAGGLAAPCRENFAAQSRVVEEEEEEEVEEEEGEPSPNLISSCKVTALLSHAAHPD